MADVFLSYASEDRDRVVAIVEVLERQGYSVWWDRHIDLGVNFDVEIERELDASKCVVVVWSRHSIGSDWVRNEASDGYERGVLVPLKIDDSRIPLAFRRIQTADLIGWKGDVDSEFVQSLIESIHKVVVHKPTTEESVGVHTRDYRLRVALLPFANQGAESELLTDGMMEDIVSGLMAFREISVIPLSVTSRYKGQSVDLVEAGRDIAADYILEGSVRIAGESLRVTVQLSSVEDREMLWSEVFDRTLAPNTLFQIQDDIKEHVSAAIADSYGVIRTKALEHIQRKPPETMTAYQAVLLAQAVVRAGWPRELIEKAIAALEEATIREPRYADAWAWLGGMYRDIPSLRNRDENLDRAEKAARRALEIDSSNQQALIVNFTVSMYRNNMTAFAQIADRALALNPNSADLHYAIAHHMAFAGMDEALIHATRATDLNPTLDPVFTPLFLHHFRKGNDELAIDFAERGLAGVGKSAHQHILLVGLAAAFGRRNEVKKAQEFVDRLRTEYGWDANYFRASLRWNNCCSDLESQLEEGLKKAGVEIPPK